MLVNKFRKGHAELESCLNSNESQENLPRLLNSFYMYSAVAFKEDKTREIYKELIIYNIKKKRTIVTGLCRCIFKNDKPLIKFERRD